MAGVFGRADLDPGELGEDPGFETAVALQTAPMAAGGIDDEQRFIVGAHGLLITRLPGKLNAAIPCGLIVTELVSNAMKHAFLGVRKGTLNIQLTSPSGDGIFSVWSEGEIHRPARQFITPRKRKLLLKK